MKPVIALSMITVGVIFLCVGSGCLGQSSANTVKTWTDVAYGTLSPSEKMDIYLPEKGKGPFPLVLFIHGGGFAEGDKKDGEEEAALSALAKGYAVVSVNYRLSGEATFPAQIADIKAAIRFLRAKASEYKIDGKLIALWGASAGGHLAALAGTSGDVTFLRGDIRTNGEFSDRVQAVVVWYGSINFLTLDAQMTESCIKGDLHDTPDSPESKYLGGQLSLVPALANATNPETYVNTSTPPFYIEHGTDDARIPSMQAIHFAALLEKVIGKDKGTLILLQGAGHVDPAFRARENIESVLDFLDKWMK